MKRQRVGKGAGSNGISGVDCHVWSLVQDNHRRVFEQDLQGKVLGMQLAWIRWEILNHDSILVAESVRGFCGDAIDGDGPYFDQILDAATAVPAAHIIQEAINARPLVVWTDDEIADRRLFLRAVVQGCLRSQRLHGLLHYLYPFSASTALQGKFARHQIEAHASCENVSPDLQRGQAERFSGVLGL